MTLWVKVRLFSHTFYHFHKHNSTFFHQIYCRIRYLEKRLPQNNHLVPSISSWAISTVDLCKSSTRKRRNWCHNTHAHIVRIYIPDTRTHTHTYFLAFLALAVCFFLVSFVLGALFIVDFFKRAMVINCISSEPPCFGHVTALHQGELRIWGHGVTLSLYGYRPWNPGYKFSPTRGSVLKISLKWMCI